jgi:hypothetical protein
LPGSYLGFATADIVWIDSDAAGFGWHAGPGTTTAGQVDLLSVLTHEFGHLAGYGHGDSVMGAVLSPGVRTVVASSSEDTPGGAAFGLAAAGWPEVGIDFRRGTPDHRAYDQAIRDVTDTRDHGTAAELVPVDVLSRTGVVATRKVGAVTDEDRDESECDRADRRFDDLFALIGSLGDE